MTGVDSLTNWYNLPLLSGLFTPLHTTNSDIELRLQSGHMSTPFSLVLLLLSRVSKAVSMIAFWVFLHELLFLLPRVITSRSPFVMVLRFYGGEMDG